MVKYRYSDIPDEMVTKEWFPLGRHIWRVYMELGPRFLMKWHMKYTYKIRELMEDRLNSAVLTGKAVINKSLKDPDKTLSFNFFPSIGMIRCDLQSGTMKQIFSESADCTFVMIDDTFQEVFFLINTHIEEGFPTDWWISQRDEEILGIRDEKTGYKVKVLPKNLKAIQKVGLRLLDIIKDVRNKRNPEYSQSSHYIIITYASNVANLITELSSYETNNALWDSFQLKSKYPNLRDSWSLFIPAPPFLKSLIYRGRQAYTLQMSKYTLDSKLAINAIENKWQDFIKQELPELWETGIKRQLIEGIPTPQLSLDSYPPDIGDPQVVREERFEFEYPAGERVKLEELKIAEDEFFSGIYLNITNKTPKNEKITKSHIISTGYGKNSKIY